MYIAVIALLVVTNIALGAYLVHLRRAHAEAAGADPEAHHAMYVQFRDS